jgi:hypothetical protein
VIVASLVVGPRLLRVCRARLFVNAIALTLTVAPLVNLLLASHPPPESPAATKILLTCTAPVLIEFLVLLGILHWRMRPR